MKKPDSPCVDVCRMNARTRLCEGCGRTIDEISAWSRLDPARRRAIMESLPARVPGAAGSGARPDEPATE
jgi:predicted Fe-S protein YdhL (DUF1289 family)